MSLDHAAIPLVAGTPVASLSEAIVLRHEDDDTIVVGGDDGSEVLCEVLVTGGVVPLVLSEGDRVLVWRSQGSSTAVVLGRVGRAHGSDVPEALTLEASQEITLRVGDGSITIRADGKILIKGKDLVSHAQRVNRIKGGSVAIN